MSRAPGDLVVLIEVEIANCQAGGLIGEYASYASVLITVQLLSLFIIEGLVRHGQCKLINMKNVPELAKMAILHLLSMGRC